MVSIVLKIAIAHSKRRQLSIGGSSRMSRGTSGRALGSGSLKPEGDTTMSTITKTTLIAALLLGLAPAAHARNGGTQPDLPRFGWPIEQQRANEASTPGWQNWTGAGSAYAQQPRGRVRAGTVRSHRVIKDDPPGS